MEKHMMELSNKIDFIANAVRGTEKMALLAEELDELCDAAETFRNTITEKRSKKGRRYTMSQYAMEQMIDEYADVMAVLFCTFDPEDMKIATEYAEKYLEAIKVRTGADLKRELDEVIFAAKALRVMAFKHRRIGSKDNPTDRTKEYVDMMIGITLPLLMAEMTAVLQPEQVARWEKAMERKIDRWHDRLQGSDEHEQE